MNREEAAQQAFVHVVLRQAKQDDVACQRCKITDHQAAPLGLKLWGRSVVCKALRMAPVRGCINVKITDASA